MAATLEQLYDFITGEDSDEARACAAISEEACTNVPANFFLNAANGAVTKLGDQLAAPGVVLPWLLGAIGAPAALVGLLVPVRQASALLPQLAASAQLRESPVRKWFWAAGAGGFGLMLLLMIPAVLLLSDAVLAGWAVIVLLGIAGLARGFSSVAFKDVLGKTIPAGRRGTLLALRATLGGALALVAGVLLRLYLSDSTSLLPYLLLVGAGGLLWLLGGLFAALTREEPGATEGGRNAIKELRAGIELLREVPGFRQFILARILLLIVTLSIPFYSFYGRSLTGGQVGDLGVFVIASSAASILSSPVWGRFADRSSRTVMMVSAAVGALGGVVALVLGAVPALQTAALFAIVILLMGFAEAGINLGRKTYLVDGAPPGERPLYAAMANTILGVITLASGALGLLQQAIGIRGLIAVFIALALVGVVVVWRMPEAEHMADTQPEPG